MNHVPITAIAEPRVLSLGNSYLNPRFPISIAHLHSVKLHAGIEAPQ